MKILHLFPYIPAPPTFGGAIRIYHILRHLSKNHDVTVAGFGNFGNNKAFFKAFPDLQGNTHFISNPWRLKFRKLFQLYSLISAKNYWHLAVATNEMQRQLDQLVTQQDFDVVQAEFPTMGYFDIKSNALKVLDAHNVEYDNFRRMTKLKGNPIRQYYYQREYEKLYDEELRVCRKQDAIFTTSERDKRLFDKDIPEVPKFVIPNGVEIDYFYPSDQKPEPHSLVFVGSIGYVPNHDGVIFFLDKILPLIRKQIPDIKVYIVGKDPPKEIRQKAGENVIITGFVEDVRPYVWKSSVYIVPLRMGGGTRLKVLEALAMRKPLVTTSIGCEGIDLTHKEQALIVDEPEKFSESVVQLLKDKKLRHKLSYSGYELVRKKYAWDVIGNHLESAYSELINTPVETG